MMNTIFALSSIYNQKIFAMILGSVALETLIFLVISIYNLIRTCFQKTKRAYSILFGVLVLIEYIILQVLIILIKDIKTVVDIGFDNKTVALILLQSTITVIVLAITQTIRRWEKKTVNKASLKEGLDSLPVGLLFYWKEGMVKLVNNKMDSISRLLTGEGIYSGTEFWDMLVSKDMKILPADMENKGKDRDDSDTADGKNECIVRLEDGSVYNFKRSI